MSKVMQQRWRIQYKYKKKDIFTFWVLEVEVHDALTPSGTTKSHQIMQIKYVNEARLSDIEWKDTDKAT